MVPRQWEWRLLIRWVTLLSRQKPLQEKIVLGYPVNMDGSAGERAELALAFKAMLERRTKLEVIMQDERLTTVAADEILQECGMPREKRKTVIDQVAAGLILQDFMENTKKGSKLADSESDTEKNNNKNLEVMNSTADQEKEKTGEGEWKIRSF